MIYLNEKGIETLIPDGAWKKLSPKQRARFTPIEGTEVTLEVKQIKATNTPAYQAATEKKNLDVKAAIETKIDDITGNIEIPVMEAATKEETAKLTMPKKVVRRKKK
jgi:hypothetical protein